MRTQSTSKANSVSGPRSLTRVLGIFHILAESPSGMTLAELSEELDSPKSSLLNLVRPLVDTGYLIHSSGLYRLGPATFRMSATVMSVWNFSNLIHPYLVELAEQSHETVYLGILDREDKLITYVDTIDSPQSIRYSISVGTKRPLYCTAAGRVLLAFDSDQKWVSDYLRDVKMEQRTVSTTADRRELRKKLEDIRAEGYSVSIGELFEESAGIAAPIYHANGKLIATIAIGAPSDRFKASLPKLKRLITEVSKKASGTITILP